MGEHRAADFAVTGAVLPRASAGAPGEFERLTSPFRRELLTYCYRMLGSVQDAEDLVQETFLRAWRCYGTFEGRSSLRTWLYRIATNACLTALERRDRWPRPAGLVRPPDEPVARYEVSAEQEDPAAIVASRQSTRLALAAALRCLSERQCAVLILREVLQCRAAEVAELLGTTTAAVNSALQRARTQLEHAAAARAGLDGPDGLAGIAECPGQRALLDRYTTAVENADPDALALTLLP